MSIVYCVPFSHKNIESLNQELQKIKEREIVVTSERLFDTNTGIFYDVEVEEFNPNLLEAFLYSRDEEDVSFGHEINQHKLIMYLLVEPENLLESIDIVQCLLNAGGIGVKNEVTGISFKKEEWVNLAGDKSPELVYEYFVNIVFDQKSIYSVGMNSFQLPDSYMHTSKPTDEEIYVINEYNFHRLINIPFNTVDYSLVAEWKKDHRFSEKDICYNYNGITLLKPNL
ncbi:hypothetical protein [Domibacillus mangrovi]|uniref:DUF4261 domain-containing protein n=1 Tax=Domibacillus mangrovi TaxID=1714354 RepID=A0A1Q5NZS6_9BACI|nr:hypothetical protein [Domibacillus mangrovi]OKL35499.1 hypothetical protein BLL40_15190 [Domibacillus mangrovi]